MKHLPEVVEGMYQTGSYSPELDRDQNARAEIL